MGDQGLLLLIGLKILIIMTSLQNIVISGFSRSPDVDGIKIFDKDDQAQNIKIKEQCFTAWSSLSKILIQLYSAALCWYT